MSQLVQRQTIIFFLPLEIEALRTNYNAGSGDDGTVHGDLTGYGSRATMILMEVSG